MERLTKIGTVTPVHSSKVGTSTLGLGFEKLDRGVFDPEKAYDKVAELGVKWIRIQSGWDRTEKQKGVYDFAWLDSIVENLIQRSLTPWMCLCYGNGLYDADAAKVFGAVGCPPIKTPEQKKAWHDYVVATVKRYTGRIKWFEIWNEPDGVWCWKHGPNGVEYGQFMIDTAAAIREADPNAKIIGGVFCMHQLEWISDVLSTGAVKQVDALSYHGYSPDERAAIDRMRAVRALCLEQNPNILFIQGETGTQSRSDGAGALRGGAWTPIRQAKCLSRLMLAHMFENVFLNSYFSCMDMIEALNGTVGDKSSYLDYGYFGVLGADFDENGIATGAYTPKPSYRALQVLSAIFREDFSMKELPVRFVEGLYSPRILRTDDHDRSGIMTKGFIKPNGSKAFVYWKSSELLTTSYESTVSWEVAGMEETPKLIDLIDGVIYSIPETMIEKTGNGVKRFLHLPLRDYPLLLTFGNFAE